MATAEGAADALGPRYAPADPTLPEPWKGLIDGSTGVLYYWNPDTNITQYEKPASLPPPLPLGPPPSTPKLAPIPGARAVQPNGVPGQQAHQVSQMSQPLGQEINLMSQQNAEQMPQTAQQTSSQTPQAGHQLGLQASGTMQQLGQLTPHHPRPQMSHQTSQQQHQMFPTSEHQVPPLHGNQIPQMYQSGQLGQSQGYQFPPQQMQYMGYQNMSQQGPPNLLPQTQHTAPFSHQQDHKGSFMQREEPDYQQGKHVGFSPSQIHQSGVPPVQNQPAGSNSIQKPQLGIQPGQAPPYGGPSFSSQQPASLGQLQQGGMDLGHQQQAPRFQNQMGPGMMHGQPPNVPPAGLSMGYEENPPGRGGSDHYFNATNDSLGIAPNQPKLATIPMGRNQQEMRMGNLPLQNISAANPVGATPVPGPTIYGHATGGAPYPAGAMMRPSPAVMSSPDAINLSSVDAYRKKHDVTVTGDNVPHPFMSFEDTGFPPEILREIHSAGFASPTPIQAQTWPIALQNKDIVAIAKTGSGKTLGYLIPAFMLLRHCRNNPLNGPTVVVLAPTRELATQIQEEACKFGRASRVSCTCLYGGAPKGPQLKELERGADIVVATPGRLNDILEMKKVDFRQVSLLVLDEADRMLDMGFEPQIRKIVNEIPPRRQTLMYTATWPKEVRQIAADLLVNPVHVNIGNADELAANKSITQYVEVVPHMEKQRRVEQILRSQERGSKIIVFCSTRKLCDQLARSIGRTFPAAAIHGDKSQGERDWVLNQFRSGKTPILVATDVAARGLDVKDVRVVINYDFPTGVEDYVHRIGRTGRAGAKGVAYTFFSDQDWKYAADLIKVLEGANQPVPPEVREIATRGGPGFGKDRGGMSRFDSSSGGGRWDSGGGRGAIRDGPFGGRGGGDMRDGSFGGRGGSDTRDGGFGGRGVGDMREGSFGGRGGGDMRDGGFGGRGGGMRDGGFGGRGGSRDGGFGGRGGSRDGGFGGRVGPRDGGFGGRGGMRDENFGGRGGSRDGSFGGRDGGWDRNDRGPQDRFMDGRGRSRGRGRGRFDSRRDIPDRSRGRSYSSSPERVRTWDARRSSRSRSRSRSRSWSRSYSRSRSWSRSRSPRRSRSRSRSFSRSPRRRERRRESKFDQKEVEGAPTVEVPLKPESGMPPISSPGKQNNALSAPEPLKPSAERSIDLGLTEHSNSAAGQ